MGDPLPGAALESLLAPRPGWGVLGPTARTWAAGKRPQHRAGPRAGLTAQRGQTLPSAPGFAIGLTPWGPPPLRPALRVPPPGAAASTRQAPGQGWRREVLSHGWSRAVAIPGSPWRAGGVPRDG